jgi:hypothetical protein
VVVEVLTDPGSHAQPLTAYGSLHKSVYRFLAILDGLTPEQLEVVHRRVEEKAAAGRRPRDRAGEVHPDGRVRDRHGRLPRRKRNLTASVDPELHEAATAAIRAAGVSTSDWIAEAIQLRLEVDAELGRRAG